MAEVNPPIGNLPGESRFDQVLGSKVPGVITTAQLADDSVTADKVAANSIGVSELALSDGTANQAIITDGSETLSFGDVKPEGAMYCFPKLDPNIYPVEDDEQLMLNLLRAEKVLLVQGTGFNWPTPDHFRVVFLPAPTELREAVSRIGRFFAALRA